ncbi:MAG: phosphate ABC transporter permease subunit PstC, partial [Clostridia bacterium]|nr:phosphate ABC transporter permease subunit PstC [Clostridia bacterium]
MKNGLKLGAKFVERIMGGIFTLCGFAAVLFVAVITVFLFVSGIPAIGEIGLKDFLLCTVWSPTSANPQYGILPFITASVMGTAGAIIIGVPIGLMCAVY